jgi:hypothetical protein
MHETHAYEVHTREVYAYEMHGYKVQLKTPRFRNRSTVRLAGEVRYVCTIGDGEIITTGENVWIDAHTYAHTTTLAAAPLNSRLCAPQETPRVCAPRYIPSNISDGECRYLWISIHYPRSVQHAGLHPSKSQQ